MKINARISNKESPSGWYRIGALKEIFQSKEIFINEIIPKYQRYPPPEKIKRPAWLLSALLERINYIYQLPDADATILQRELISTLPTVERLLPGKKILDVDDAIFLKKRGLAAKNAARACIGVVCGNKYLADYFSNYNKSIRIIPTGVNVSKMKVDANRLVRSEKKIIGWIGTPGNLPFFESITPDLKAFFRNNSSQVEFRIVTSHADAIPHDLKEFCVFVKWYPGIEFDELPKWTAGLMPLADNDWAKGKCSFKMLQYMSAGIPVIVSPYGMNSEVLAKNEIGFGPKTGDEWYFALESLVKNLDLNQNYGAQARYLAEKDFSLESVVNKWQEAFNSWL